MNENVMDKDRVAAIDKVRAAFSELEPDEGGAALIQLLADLHDRAVAGERERAAAIVSTAVRTARIRNNDRLANDLRDCLTAIQRPTPPPEPEELQQVTERLTDPKGYPAPEPMTVARLIAIHKQRRSSHPFNWSLFQDDLIELVQTQARRDVNHCLDVGYGHPSDMWAEASKECAERVAKSAGLGVSDER